MGHSLKSQLCFAVEDCTVFGTKKRSEKFNKEADTDWKIYSRSYKSDMLDTAKSLAAFLKTEYPELRMARDIEPKHIQTFLDSKADSCVQKTLERVCSRLKKLENACKHTFARSDVDWKCNDVNVPASRKDATWKKDKAIDWDTSKKILDFMADSGMKSEVSRAVVLSRNLGMRSNETVCIKARNLHFEDGLLGFGYAEIARGPAGGAKGGRPRLIPILNEQGRTELMELVKGRKPDDYVVMTVRGGKMSPDTVRQGLGRVLSAMGLDEEYKGNKFHAFRKNFAQSLYDIVRSGTSRGDAVGITNEALGHRYNRSEKDLSPYVANIH